MFLLFIDKVLGYDWNPLSQKMRKSRIIQILISLHISKLRKDTKNLWVMAYGISLFQISQVLAEITHLLIIFTGISNYKSVSHQSQKHVDKERSGKS